MIKPILESEDVRYESPARFRKRSKILSVIATVFYIFAFLLVVAFVVMGLTHHAVIRWIAFLNFCVCTASLFLAMSNKNWRHANIIENARNDRPDLRVKIISDGEVMNHRSGNMVQLHATNDSNMYHRDEKTNNIIINVNGEYLVVPENMLEEVPFPA